LFGKCNKRDFVLQDSRIVHEYLGMLLDSDVHTRLEWELVLFTVCGTGIVGAFGWLLLDAIRRSRGTRRTLRNTVIRQGQHDETLVKDVRAGVSYPDLGEKEE
jgi:hypothetical protein